MKKTLLFIAIAIIGVFGAFAQPLEKWVYVTESSNATYAIIKTRDAVVIDPERQVLSIWVKVTFDKVQPNGSAYQIGLQHFDLKSNRFAFQEVTGYSENGKALYHHQYDDEHLKWQPAILNSVGYELMNMAHSTFEYLTSEPVVTTK